MIKAKILQAVLLELEAELSRLMAANQSASAGATDSETRAETKWDTCGLEASYLARGHAQQFTDLAARVMELRGFNAPSFKDRPIGIGALVKAEFDSEVMHYILLPCGGGKEVEEEGFEVTVITPESPVGRALMDKRVGESCSFRKDSAGKILSVA